MAICTSVTSSLNRFGTETASDGTTRAPMPCFCRRCASIAADAWSSHPRPATHNTTVPRQGGQVPLERKTVLPPRHYPPLSGRIWDRDGKIINQSITGSGRSAASRSSGDCSPRARATGRAAGFTTRKTASPMTSLQSSPLPIRYERVYRGIPVFGRTELLMRNPQLSFDGRC